MIVAPKWLPSHRLSLVIGGFLALGCELLDTEPFQLSSNRKGARVLSLGERVPDAAENEVVGAVAVRVGRHSALWQKLVHCESRSILFKDEERSGADHRMTSSLCVKLTRLGDLVATDWPDLRVRVTEAWDENGEHGRGSLHYEGRAADITTSDMDSAKLGRLGQLAVMAGFDWVYYENRTHVHVSVKRAL